jgi:hypothetical protein
VKEKRKIKKERKEESKRGGKIMNGRKKQTKGRMKLLDTRMTRVADPSFFFV